MKLNKLKWQIFALLLFFAFESRAQIYFAGDTLAVYTDVDPDASVGYTCNPSGDSSYYYLDVNGDTQADFKISAYCITYMAGTASTEFEAITPLNTNSSVQFGRIDSAFNNYYGFWWVTKVALPLNIGDSINSCGSIWDSTTLYLNNGSHMTGSTIAVWDWVSSLDYYLGVRYISITDTIYGWIRVNCPSGNNCYIKDYSYSSEFSKAYYCDFSYFNIYPNPASNELQIDCIGNDEFKINMFDVFGRKAIDEIISEGPKTTINFGDIRNGIYILEITISDVFFTKKIIINH